MRNLSLFSLSRYKHSLSFITTNRPTNNFFALKRWAEILFESHLFSIQFHFVSPLTKCHVMIPNMREHIPSAMLINDQERIIRTGRQTRSALCDGSPVWSLPNVSQSLRPGLKKGPLLSRKQRVRTRSSTVRAGLRRKHAPIQKF